MRLESVKNTPRIVIYLGLVGLLLILLAISGSFDNQNINKKASATKVQGTQTQTSDELKTENDVDNDQESSDEASSSNTSNQNSNSTKVNISVSTNSTNGETTGSAEITVTTNGETQDFSEALGECLTAGKIKVSTENSKIKCKSDDGKLSVYLGSRSRQSTKNESSSEINVEETNKVR
ncbi:MAG: hypothetical protein A2Z11_01510 [Candidatus Woykebacteria bacterium RBG_16_43_9]|uniref:Uncharacterized protein n=1 Tax=Candidatus Woykebacteria bacterium RBG_16_43_9 TaxID=1802596 RepID=A0A1G1WHC4_9BACT|nr:MAG: hypothetical protein A2Z11_01510 [Candidatus Woykebacteria bacterium RBG_16_43_9]